MHIPFGVTRGPVSRVGAVAISSFAEAVFGDEDRARHWLSRPKQRLSGTSPLQVLDQVDGAQAVMDWLNEIDQGWAG